MRIVTWNCYRGDLREQAALLEPLRADIVVLQECAKPSDEGTDGEVWFGESPTQGVGVIGFNRHSVARGPFDPALTHSVFPVTISGASAFNVLAVWSKPKPSYVAAIMAGLDTYSGVIRSGPTIVVGDFNSHSRFDKGNGRNTHVSLVSRLKDEFGLVSAYHAFRSEAVDEEPTLYHLWNESKPFHIDYCFIPEDWVPKLREVKVGDFEAWAAQSDHRPLLVDIDLSVVEARDMVFTVRAMAQKD